MENSYTKFNKLTIIERLPDRGHKTKVVKCLCECGNNTVVQYNNLVSGHTKSCGCIENIGNLKHGMSYTKEYKSYHKMLERCYNPKQDNYESYGGRGIIVCDRWRESFENFFSDMGLKPTSKHSIERTDHDGNYEPSNCTWETQRNQCNNKRNNVFYEHNGVSKTQSQWARHLGIPHGKIIDHIKKGVTFSEIVEYIKLNGNKRLQFKR